MRLIIAPSYMNFKPEILSFFVQIYLKIKKYLFIVSNSNNDIDCPHDTTIRLL